MQPARYDMEIFKGGDFNIGFSGKLDDGQTLTFDGYTDIKLYVLQPWVHTQDEMSTPLLQLSKIAGDFTVAGNGESFSLDITAVATAALAFSQGRYFMDLIDGVTVDKFLLGKFTVIGPEDI